MITSFSGPNRFLSNFWHAPIEVEVTVVMTKTGITFSWPVKADTVEHGFQACKAADGKDFYAIMNSASPAIAKQMGRNVGMIPEWEEIRVEVMRQLVTAKFEQNPDEAIMLADTGDVELIEGNHWGDTFWGICRGKGENNLGTILMGVREFIQEVLWDVLDEQAQDDAVHTHHPAARKQNPYSEGTYRHRVWSDRYHHHLLNERQR
jgi:hypothetical protein